MKLFTVGTLIGSLLATSALATPTKLVCKSRFDYDTGFVLVSVTLNGKKDGKLTAVNVYPSEQRSESVCDSKLKYTETNRAGYAVFEGEGDEDCEEVVFRVKESILKKGAVGAPGSYGFHLPGDESDDGRGEDTLYCKPRAKK